MNKLHIICAVILLVVLVRCGDKSQKNSLFTKVSTEESRIDFMNNLTESKDFNIIEYLYFYNGGGVACGDINNDGLIDLYFSSNQQSNRLYLNKGNFQFEDITEKSGTAGVGNWKTGVTMADVNGDGYLDIFVCGVGNYKKFDSRNQILVNNGDLTFTDRTSEYGLDFKGFSTQSVFFDYDLDGDLDCYLLNHSVHSASSYVSVSNRVKTDSLSGDQFYRNDLILNGTNTGKTKFVNVTHSAGILSSRLGYGLGIGVSDVNLDGFPDIYVSNDFQENDYLYVNNGDGTFKQVLENAFAHSSRFSMGNDIADFNNDLRPDIMTTDMLPRDEAVIKTSAGEDAFEVFKYKLKFGYHYQVARNCLQLNRFVSDSLLTFSDIAPLAGVEATDWSWCPLFVDFDLDGWKDLFVSNGIVRRPNDLDYINFISNQAIQDSLATMDESDLEIIKSMPEGKTSNFIFKNTKGLKYEDKTSEWGLSIPSFSNGGAFADLDNDGDIDLVVNNINDHAFLYKNNLSETRERLTIELRGNDANKFGLGSKIIAYSGGIKQLFEVSATRGFCSSSDTRVVLGAENKIDSLLVIWPNRTFEKRFDLSSGKKLIFNQKDATGLYQMKNLIQQRQRLIPLAAKSVPNYVHQEDDYNSFNNEGLIPQMLTTQGPPIAVGDVNKDGLDDIFVGGAKNQSGTLFLQTTSGEWREKTNLDFLQDKAAEDVGAALFDADGDKDLDLVVAGGGQNPEIKPEYLKPRIYFNDGAGNFSKRASHMPEVLLNASVVRPCDYDGDGDIDLFIGASVLPFLYGMSPISYLLNNNGKGQFAIASNWLGHSRFDNPTQVRPGMVKDGVWCDLNKDGLQDLVLVGEWMPVTVLIQNQNHQFDNQTEQWGLASTSGWWNTIVAKDFDGDGDHDFVVGNLGENSRLKVSPQKPLTMYLGDFDSNGGSDHILVYYNGDKSYPFASRDQLVKQLPHLKKKFLKYSDYRNVILDDIVTPQQKGNSAKMQVNVLSSSYVKNDNNRLVLSPLPVEAQMAPIYAISVEDVNGDDSDDLLLGGNLNAVQPDFGRYDSGIGLVLLGDGKGNWKGMDAQESGFVVKGEVRNIRVFSNAKRERIILVSRNNQSLTGFKLQSP